MRNIKVLKHVAMNKELNEYGVRWSHGMVTKRMAMQIAWRVDLITSGVRMRDVYTYDRTAISEAEGVMIQVFAEGCYLDGLHCSETIRINGIPHIYNFHWEAPAHNPVNPATAWEEEADLFM